MSKTSTLERNVNVICLSTRLLVTKDGATGVFLGVPVTFTEDFTVGPVPPFGRGVEEDMSSF